MEEQRPKRQHSEEKEEYRKRIVEEIHKAKLVEGIAWSETPKRGINYETKIHQDVAQHCYLKLMMMNVDTLIELYEFAPLKTNKKLLNYIGKMIKNDGFISPGNPKQAVASNILFGSTFRDNVVISPTEMYGDYLDDGSGLFNSITQETEVGRDKYDLLWDVVCKELGQEEVDFLHDYLRRKQGTKKPDQRQFRDLQHKIKSIVFPKPKKVKPVKVVRVKKPNYLKGEQRKQKILERTELINKLRDENDLGIDLEVHQFTLNGEYIQTFPSTKVAAKAIGLYPKFILNVCYAKNNHCRGYVWSYFLKDGVTKIVNTGTNSVTSTRNRIGPKGKEVYQFTLDGQFIQSFLSVKHAANAVGSLSGNISHCATGKARR
jgi:hypothetical protein